MEKNTQKSGSSLAKIDKVDSMTNFHQSTGGQWLNVFQKINPLGTIAEAYAKTLAYRLEVKRLEVEQQRIKQQAAIAHDVIDKTFQLKMEELSHRRIALIGFYETVNRELTQIHIERKLVLEMAQEANKACLDKNASLEEKHLYKEMAIQMISELPNFGNQANIQLKTLVRSLPIVEITNRLIEG